MYMDIYMYTHCTSFAQLTQLFGGRLRGNAGVIDAPGDHWITAIHCSRGKKQHHKVSKHSHKLCNISRAHTLYTVSQGDK